jgi:hypothetical protein
LRRKSRGSCSLSKSISSTDAIIADYLALKNALAKDDSKLSATLEKK